MQNLGKTETTANRLDIVWHCVLVSLLLLVIINFFYLKHRLIERIERELEVLGLVFQAVPAKQSIHRNLDRWHDSSLIFVAIKDFQAENNNRSAKTLGQCTSWFAKGFFSRKQAYCHDSRCCL